MHKYAAQEGGELTTMSMIMVFLGHSKLAR